MFLFLLATSALAQQQPAGPDPGSKSLSLEERQDIIKDRVTRLEDRMFQLSQAIKKSEPEKAGQLMQSLGAARGMMIRAKMEEITKKIEESQYADAVDSQKAVQADLQALLKMLMEGPDQLEDRRKEIEQLEELRKQLDGVIKEQREARQNAQAAAGKPADNLAAAVAQLEKLAAEQQALSAKTAKPGEDMPAAAERQAELQAETESLADELRESQAEGNPSDADGAMGEAASDMEKAAEAMESAAQQLRQNNPDQARPPQDEAQQQLAEALKKLKDKMQRDVAQRKESAPLQKQSDEQKKITDKTRSLGQKMKESSEGQQGGEPGEQGEQGQEGQQGEQGQQGEKGQQGQQGEQQKGDEAEGDANEQTPGSERVEEAVPFQEEAEQQLDAQDPNKAAEAQAKALEKLEEAQRELENKLEQLRKEQQEELLAALESRFKAMLARQLEVNKGTDRLDELGATNWRRADQLELAELSQKQAWVGEEAEKALYILKEEGTTVVFPQVVEHVRDDAAEAGRLLAAANTSQGTRNIQASIAETLRELIEAIEKKQAENEENEGSQSGEQDPNQSQPLLPASAELKLLRSCQLRVNESTQQLESEITEDSPETDESRSRREKLARRQEQVHDMARSMHEAIRRAQ